MKTLIIMLALIHHNSIRPPTIPAPPPPTKKQNKTKKITFFRLSQTGVNLKRRKTHTYKTMGLARTYLFSGVESALLSVVVGD